MTAVQLMRGKPGAYLRPAADEDDWIVTDRQVKRAVDLRSRREQQPLFTSA
jgi:hypothetical protein